MLDVRDGAFLAGSGLTLCPSPEEENVGRHGEVRIKLKVCLTVKCVNSTRLWRSSCALGALAKTAKPNVW